MQYSPALSTFILDLDVKNNGRFLASSKTFQNIGVDFPAKI